MSSTHVLSELHALDLNLLVALDLLAEERSVTRAAARAGVTQSAMSHTLRRLRELFDDPLLVRGAGGMVLSARAEALRGPLRAALAGLAQALVEPEGFDPATSTRAFRLAAPDLFDILALPRLLPVLAREAPGVSLAVAPRPADLSEALEGAALDLAIEPLLLDEAGFEAIERVSGELRRRVLFRDRMRCFVRRDHPALGRSRRLGIRAFTRLGHVLVSPSGAGPGLVDRALAARGKQRRVVVRVPDFSSALAIAASTELVLTAPSALSMAVGAADSLVSLALPLDLPEHALTMVWHPRVHADAGHRWLRERLAELTRDLGPVLA